MSSRNVFLVTKPTRRTTRLVLGIMSVAALCLFYLNLSRQQHIRNPTDTTIPSLTQFRDGVSQIFKADPDTGERWFWSDVRATGGRLALGLVTGIVLAVVVGTAMGCYTPLGAVLSPPINFIARIPPTAMLALYFVLFGTDLELFVAIVALGIFPAMAVSIYQSIQKDVSQDLIHKAYTLGASHMEVVSEIIFRQILPRILQNIQLQVGPAMVFIIAAEWVLADVGFGYRLRMQSRLLNMSVVYVYLVFLGLTGFVIDWSLVAARRCLCRWFGE